MGLINNIRNRLVEWAESVVYDDTDMTNEEFEERMAVAEPDNFHHDVVSAMVNRKDKG